MVSCSARHKIPDPVWFRLIPCRVEDDCVLSESRKTQAAHSALYFGTAVARLSPPTLPSWQLLKTCFRSLCSFRDPFLQGFPRYIFAAKISFRGPLPGNFISLRMIDESIPRSMTSCTDPSIPLTLRSGCQTMRCAIILSGVEPQTKHSRCRRSGEVLRIFLSIALLASRPVKRD